MIFVNKLFLAGSLLLLAPASFADLSDIDEGIYFYHLGQRAAGRMQNTANLSDAELKQAVRGFEAQLRNQPPAYTPAQIQQATEQHQGKIQAALEDLSTQNQVAGEAYLSLIEALPQYRFLDQGLAYKINTQGTGPVPDANNQVQIEYIGKHLDGREFVRSDEPVWSSMQGVIPGWRIALLEMPAGSDWTLVVPPHLAYGEHGATERVGPQETLIFEIHLKEVK